MMSIEVRDLMVTKVITIDPDASIKKAIMLMNEQEIGCLIVCKEQHPVGIITERDMLKRVLPQIPKLAYIKVQKIMSSPVITVKSNTEIEQAVSLMVKQKIKKLPVTDNEGLSGLVTLTDILRFQPQLIRIYKILSSDVVPPRMKKVFDYYTLLYPGLRGSQNQKNLSFELPTG